MREIISLTAAAMAASAAMASPLTVEVNAEMRNLREQRHRDLSSSHDHGWGAPPPGAWKHGPWGPKPYSSSSSSGKSGKSGGSSGSGKSGKGTSSSGSVDGWHGPWGHGKPPFGPPGWFATSDSGSGSSKSGKGSKGSSSSSIDHWHGGWGKPGFWGPPSSSSGSSKSGKGSKGSKGSSSSSSSHDGWNGSPGWGHPGHHHSPWDHDGWYGAWSGSSSSSSSGKSGKSGGSSGSGKSGKASSSSSDDHVHGHWHWVAKPPSSSSSSKSGKGSKSKSGKSKSSKGSSSSSPDGKWVYHVHQHSHSSTSLSFKPDSSSPGICAPSFDEGGLECDVDHEWSYCTKPGSQSECGPGSTCYDKELCPEFSTKDPIGVCDAHGLGLECDEVTTYCTEPGEHAECGSGRNCYDAGLCGFGKDEYNGVCGMAYHGGKHSGLDCDEVTTKCTEPGEHAECAYGAKCFDAGLCSEGAGFCSSSWGFDCEDVSTYCAHPGESGQCPHGQKCYDTKVCDPTLSPTKAKTPSPTPSPTVLELKEICFHEGTVIDCAEWESSWGSDGWKGDGHGSKSGDGDASGWGNDGHGDEDDSKSEEDDDAAWFGDGHGDASGSDDGKGEAISVPFTYTVDTNGKVKPDSVITEVENAILDDVAEYIEDNEEYSHFSGKIAAAPEDEIADDDWCGDGHAVRCSVVKGEMSIYPGWGDDGWEGDGHNLYDVCDALDLIEESMDGNDYTEVDGVTNAKYRNGNYECNMVVVAGAAIMVQPQEDDNDLSAAGAFGILAACAALLALAFLVARKFKRKPKPEPVRDEISLISNSLNGSLYEEKDDPYANTIDVHKCTSIYCNCNKGGTETTFLPAPKKVDMAEVQLSQGISPTAVTEADGEFFNKDDEDELEQGPDLEPQSSQASNESKGSIMRVPIRSQFEEPDRPLTPVNEVPHDSEIDTEMESLAGENDETTIPPPPPLAFHPAYNQESGEVHRSESSDEISI